MSRHFIIAFLAAVLVFPLCAKAYAGTQETAHDKLVVQLGYEVINAVTDQTIADQGITASGPCQYCCHKHAIVVSFTLSPSRTKAIQLTPPQRTMWPMPEIAAAFVSPVPPLITRRPHSYRVMLAVTSRLLI